MEEFRRKVVLKYLKAGALIVAYDAPFLVSRLAVKWNKSTKTRRAFSFYFRMFWDKKAGKMRPSGYEPGIAIESMDAAKAIYRPIKYKFHDRDAEQEEENKKFSNVHILDLKTLTSVLTGEVYSFPTACDIFGAPASRGRRSLFACNQASHRASAERCDSGAGIAESPPEEIRSPCRLIFFPTAATHQQLWLNPIFPRWE